MKPKKVPATRLDYRMVALQAQAFVAFAKPTIDSLRTTNEEAARRAVAELPVVACAATLLALGLELHLKAIHIGGKREPPATHSLLRLFESLPSAEKHDIDARYAAKVGAVDPEHALSLVIQIREATDPQKDWPEDQEFVAPDYSVRALLTRSANAFVAWRYFYESVPDNKRISEKVLDHVPMFLFWESLDDFIRANAR